MNTEQVIVVLLLIAILLSVVTLAITVGADVVPTPEAGNSAPDFATASVVLDIVPNPALGGSS